MKQKIINQTLALNLFEESNKSSNWFVAFPNNIRYTNCYFTENIPFHYFQYVCLALSYCSEFWIDFDFNEYKDNVKSSDNIADDYNREQKLDSMAILNCREDSSIGAFSRFWLKTKVGKNLTFCFSRTRYNLMTKSPDDITQSFSFSYSTFNKKLNRFGEKKSNCSTLPTLRNPTKELLVEFSKQFLVKK